MGGGREERRLQKQAILPRKSAEPGEEMGDRIFAEKATDNFGELSVRVGAVEKKRKALIEEEKWRQIKREQTFLPTRLLRRSKGP